MRSLLPCDWALGPISRRWRNLPKRGGWRASLVLSPSFPVYNARQGNFRRRAETLTAIEQPLAEQTAQGSVGMQTYPVEVEPEQIVDWIMAESQIAPSELRVSARRAIETRELPTTKELRLGEEERDDLTEIAAIGTL